MSGIRSITRRATPVGFATAASAPLRVDSADNTVKLIPIGSGTTEISLAAAISASGARVAAGISTLASGVATIATGLTSVLSFQTTVLATGFATGATEATTVVVTGAPATGAVACVGYRLFTTTASASGTGQFYWVAVGM